MGPRKKIKEDPVPDDVAVKEEQGSPEPLDQQQAAAAPSGRAKRARGHPQAEQEEPERARRGRGRQGTGTTSAQDAAAMQQQQHAAAGGGGFLQPRGHFTADSDTIMEAVVKVRPAAAGTAAAAHARHTLRRRGVACNHRLRPLPTALLPGVLHPHGAQLQPAVAAQAAVQQQQQRLHDRGPPHPHQRALRRPPHTGARGAGGGSRAGWPAVTRKQRQQRQQRQLQERPGRTHAPGPARSRSQHTHASGQGEAARQRQEIRGGSAGGRHGVRHR